MPIIEIDGETYHPEETVEARGRRHYRPQTLDGMIVQWSGDDIPSVGDEIEVDGDVYTCVLVVDDQVVLDAA